jgi:hypothetical protein
MVILVSSLTVNNPVRPMYAFPLVSKTLLTYWSQITSSSSHIFRCNIEETELKPMLLAEGHVPVYRTTNSALKILSSETNFMTE